MAVAGRWVVEVERVLRRRCCCRPRSRWTVIVPPRNCGSGVVACGRSADVDASRAKRTRAD